ncbi:Disease resistance protein RPM1 [Glycine soja]|nr:Disease resistance protein RPM1 [Glycine soja]
MAEMAVSFARDKLLSLLSNEAKLLWDLHTEFAEIKTELDFIQAFLKDADRRAEEEGDSTNEGIRTLVKQLREASFRIEDVIDEYLIFVEQQPDALGCAALFFECDITHFIEYLKRRHHIASEIQQIKSVVDGIMQRGKKYNFLRQPSVEQGQSSNAGSQSIQWHDPRIASRYLDEAEVVGFEGPRDELIDWLVEGPAERTVISVVGMGGLGKTTLASRVFNNQKVVGHFDFHAWITVSQSYTVEGMMRDLLKKLCKEKRENPPQDISEMDRDSLIDEVRNYLQQKRYVVILDDVWSVELWGQIKSAMFDNKNGSRILITTRKTGVVESCKNSPFDKVHELEPLSSEKSMELFYKKAFQFDFNGCCPDHLLNISSEIVKKCKGLPLAIVAIGGLLSGKEKTTFEWEKIRQSLNSEMEKNHHLIGITKILGFSYDDLPYYLKSCLLYFGIYPEDYKVKSTRLIRQWVAEGFVKDEGGKTLEDVAQQYLAELIGRSLVQVSSVTVDGKAKSCHVHDLLWDMILRKFKDLSFCQHISKEDESMSSGMIRRLSIATNSIDLVGSTESSHIRSLLVFSGKESALTDEFVQRISKKCRLLKVLDFEDGRLPFVPENWENLVHLKYLSLRPLGMETKSLTKFIGKLHNLETLDVRHATSMELPKEICKLTRLRHLLGDHMRLFQLKNSFGDMTSLQTLHQVNVDPDEEELINDDDVVELIRELGKLKNLRSLGLTGVKEGLGSALCSSINQMQNLEKLHIRSASNFYGFYVIDLPVISSLPMLRKLKLEGKLNKFPEWIPQLQNLVKLTLICSHLTEDPLKSLQNMPHLLFLRIGPLAYGGESLYFKDGGFMQLKELYLRYLSNLSSIIIDKGSLNSLETLHFEGIGALKTVPCGIQHLENLLVLHILDMPSEFEQCIAPEGGPEHSSIQHVPLVRIATSFGRKRIIHHSKSRH